MTNVLILCAGKGQRFVDAGLAVPKPMIPLGEGATPMVKLTTDSLPFMKEMQPGTVALAVLQDHIDNWHIDKVIRPLYNDPIIVPFPTSPGHLKTAFQALEWLLKNDYWERGEPLLILDSDNKYDGAMFSKYITQVEKLSEEFAAICYFEPVDDKTHWCFAQMKGLEVFNLLEKHPAALEIGGKPMVGTFYFSSAQLFNNVASDIITLEQVSKKELYISDAIQRLLHHNISVYGCKVTDVVPLGTPEDVKKYERGPIRIAIDLDDTINHSKKANEDYGDEKLQKGVIEILRRWKKQGHYIIIHTARHTNTCDGNLGKVLARQGLTTLQWLKDNKVPYDEIWWSKPHADIFIDDKGFRHKSGDWKRTEQSVERFVRGEEI